MKPLLACLLPGRLGTAAALRVHKPMEDLAQLQAPVKPVRRENTYITEPSGYGEVRRDA